MGKREGWAWGGLGFYVHIRFGGGRSLTLADVELLLLAILVAACRTLRLIPEQEIRPSLVDHV